MIIYIAGPMTGYHRYNFDAFHAAARQLRAHGWEVLNPAEMDESIGFDPSRDTADKVFLEDAMKRDIDAILQADAIALLPGWEKSTGAQAEMHLAKWRHIPIYTYPDMQLLGKEDVLEEAMRLTKGDRQAAYGPPDQDFKRTANMWTALFEDMLKDGVRFTSSHVAQAMILLKQSRQLHSPKRDNWTDTAGYARCGFLCDQAKGK